MSFTLNDHWVWDHWILRDHDSYRLFFLRASRALHDPERRHFRASLGQAISKDCKTWELLPDALVHSDMPAFDDKAIWTGSTIQHPLGGYRLFYTGISYTENGMVQRIGWADSTDGISFKKTCTTPLEADPQWYLKRQKPEDDECWRDPYVFFANEQWHMLITAKTPTGDPKTCGVVGHAVSDDLDNWKILEPLSAPANFGHLEVCQSHTIDGKHWLIFSCDYGMQANTPVSGEGGEVWIARGESPLGPWDIANARYVKPNNLYAGQLFFGPDDQWQFTGFTNFVDGTFQGTLPDPLLLSEITLHSESNKKIEP